MGEKVLEIDEYFKAIKKRYRLIIICTVITTILGVLSAIKIVPIYIGNTKIYIGKENDYMKLYSDDEIEYYQKFMDTFYEVMEIDNFMEKSLDKYNVKLKAPIIKTSLNISRANKSPMFTISYTSYEEEVVENVLKAICNELENQVDELQRNEKVQIISDISVGSIISSKSKRVLMSFALGVVCALVIIFVLYYVDDTVKNKEKLESLLPIPVLGEIPAHEKKFVKKEKCNVNNRRNATINISRGI